MGELQVRALQVHVYVGAPTSVYEILDNVYNTQSLYYGILCYCVVYRIVAVEVIMYVLVITWPRVPYAKYWHSSDVMPEGRRPKGITSLLCQYLAYAHEGPYSS